MSNITRVSLPLADAVIVNDAAVQLLKIYRANGARKGRAGESISESIDLEAAIRSVMTSVKEVLGSE